jgi:hypothetical protein
MSGSLSGFPIFGSRIGPNEIEKVEAEFENSR